MKKYIVYIIQSENKRYYIGTTSDIQRRLKEHNEGLSTWTKRFKNWKLIYSEKFDKLSQARKREIFFKKQKGGDGFFKIIKDNTTRDRAAVSSSGS
ncbi:MAG: endonuclease [Candidatus Kerfeldbacteria bacterium CG08_land_8_20_14_0_20_40_16]|uniref:Endonuclease n=1 Tax=Candidatus Kerfeldbacteria bacterium CG08_land_8_20_14_0_20_40_16 TaxID=2014244 RepID=A0A2H0YV57_9BACT|nr:MAG: endonuclease [Candidatus Kerfeldbacteria bacterium CG08_land_8_20_14_0_20_40_16]